MTIWLESAEMDGKIAWVVSAIRLWAVAAGVYWMERWIWRWVRLELHGNLALVVGASS